MLFFFSIPFLFFCSHYFLSLVLFPSLQCHVFSYFTRFKFYVAVLSVYICRSAFISACLSKTLLSFAWRSLNICSSICQCYCIFFIYFFLSKKKMLLYRHMYLSLYSLLFESCTSVEYTHLARYNLNVQTRTQWLNYCREILWAFLLS